MPPRALCHCSLNWFRTALPSQQPRSHASASNEGGGADGAVGATLCVAGGAVGGPAGCVAGGAVVCPCAAPAISAATTHARTIRSGCLDPFIPIRFSLRPRQRQGQKQVLRVEVEAAARIPRH